MRNLIRRTAVLAGAAVVLLGTGTGVAAAQPPLPSAGGSSTSASTTSPCSPGAPGLGFYNGKVCIGTTQLPDGRFAMEDPARPGLSCRDEDHPGEPFTQRNNTWGNGKPADLKTACVDAMYAAGEMWDMLRAWLGRNGFDGRGHAARIEVGSIKCISQFTSPPALVRIGRVCLSEHPPEPDPRHRQKSSMDIVAHEFGHLVFNTTPGGANHAIFENRALNEGAGDIFAQLTIAFADNPRVPLTYTIGSQFGKPYRIMYRPSLAGGANCWSRNLKEVTHGDIYAAAGPLNHWFYLLAEGSNPAGRPASPTCDRSTLTGLGIRLAGKIFYDGLLLKTRTWQYRDARRATLRAAKRLFPGSCTVFDKVKAAWNAVSVPARPNDPTCTIRTPQLAFHPPVYNYEHVQVGETASKTFTLANSGGSATGALTITLSGPGAAEFAITGTTCRGALPPRQSCKVTVAFAPTRVGKVTARLTAAGTRPEARATARLDGTGSLLLVDTFGKPWSCCRQQ